MTPLRQRMLDAMQVRGFAQRTQECYCEAIARMARHYHRSPELLSPPEIEAYLLHLVKDRKLSFSTVNQAASASRFLFETVLQRKDQGLRPPMARVPQKQPHLLSRQEIARLFACCGHPAYRMALQTIYASGLRVSEVAALRVADIDSAPERMCVRVNAGKGGADRYSLLSQSLLALLRRHCQTYAPQRTPGGWLFANALGTDHTNIENIPQPEGLLSKPRRASHLQTKTRWRPVRASHRVSGLVQRLSSAAAGGGPLHLKLCCIEPAIKDIIRPVHLAKLDQSRRPPTSSS